VLDECPAVCLKTRDGAADVFVDLNNLLHGACLQQCARHSLLHAEYDALAGLDSDGCTAELDGFKGVFDLEETAFGREGAGKLLERGNSKVDDRTYLMPRSGK
jgi:hypothetical protein